MCLKNSFSRWALSAVLRTHENGWYEYDEQDGIKGELTDQTIESWRA
jgi:hypothetical protein